jgi:hypothetical protein
MKKLLFLFLILLAGTLAMNASPAYPPGAPALEAAFSEAPLFAVAPEAVVLVPVLFAEPAGTLSVELVFIVPAGEPSVSFMICTMLYEDSGPGLIAGFRFPGRYPLLC